MGDRRRRGYDAAMLHRAKTVLSAIAGSLLPAVLAFAAPIHAQDYGKLRRALGDIRVPDGWIYEDIDAGYAAAKKTGKPLLVAFR